MIIECETCPCIWFIDDSVFEDLDFIRADLKQCPMCYRKEE